MDRRTFLKQSTTCLVAGATVSTLTRAFGAPSKQGRPNIVYVLTDQWRAQATGYAGDPNVKTPNLDALAARSVNFENAVSVCPVCTPYRASLLTGRYPLTTGMFLNDLYLPAEELCMAELFKQAGYETGYIGKWHLDGHGRSTYIPEERRQGFEYWKVLECTHNYNASAYYAGNDTTKLVWKGYDSYAQTRDAQEYIRQHTGGKKPFLLVIGYGTPHFPHHTAPQDLKAKYPPASIKLRPNVPEKMKDRARKEGQGYYAHCAALDRCIGDLQETLKKTGTLENTIFVFTSDHGEMLGSQGHRPCGKQRPWDESIRVPFLISYPARTGHKGRTLKAPINTPDILPSLLTLSGIEIPGSIEGEDLSGMVTGEQADEDRAALVMNVSPFADYFSGKAYRAVRTSRYTYVRSQEGPWLLYDNEKDPYQMQNLVGDDAYADLQKELEGKLQDKLKQTGDKFLSPAEHRAVHGYEVGRGGAIPYHGNHKVQSPSRKS